MPKRLAAFLFAPLFLTGMIQPLFAEEAKPSGPTALERLTAIEKQLAVIESNQKKILENQDKTFEEFRKLRIYIHKN